jgi:hypothetical protein
MFEFMAAFIASFSASISLAHAVEAYLAQKGSWPWVSADWMLP